MRRTLIAAAGTAFVCGALAAPSLSAGATVKIGDNFYVKTGARATVTVKRGSTVTWKWTGHNPHNVTVTAGPQKFHSATQTRGAFAHKFTKAGIYSIICTVHPTMMIMKVKVA